MLILGQKACFLGPTIFKIPQPNWHYPSLSNKFSLVFTSFVYLLAIKHMGIGQSSGGLWVENWDKIWFVFFQIFQKLSIFQPFLFLCLFLKFCESGVHSYHFYWLKSTSSQILRFEAYWGHLVWGWFSLCYFAAVHFSYLV